MHPALRAADSGNPDSGNPDSGNPDSAARNYFEGLGAIQDAACGFPAKFRMQRGLPGIPDSRTAGNPGMSRFATEVRDLF
jgi:hypothetical protein